MLHDKNTPSTPGPTMNQIHGLSAIQCFSLFFTTVVWEFLVNRTNEYAAHRKADHAKSHSMYKNWKPVPIPEMKAFVRIILNMELIQLSKI